MKWDSIAGHTGVIEILKRMLASGRVPHALLFTGPSGVGKMLTARIFATAMLCEGNDLSKPCGRCLACQKVLNDTHPDLVVIANDGASIKIDQVRALQHEVALAPYHGGRRVFILEAVEGLTAQAANSLLKILEEPPESAMFIMTAAQPHAILPTVLSRCRVISFKPLSFSVLTDWLVEKGVDTEGAAVAARLGGGRIGVALALLNPDGLTTRNRAVDLVEALPNGDASLIWETAGALDKLEPGELGKIFSFIAIILRDLIMISVGQPSLVFNLDIVAKLEAMVTLWNEECLRRAWDGVKEASQALDANANSRLTYEALMIKLINAAKEGHRC
ncbi:MAG: polymerase delta prime subunit [Firmicutes bacterium]|nr:polymerase delta prime subunit [Bacillota bacterium]